MKTDRIISQSRARCVVLEHHQQARVSWSNTCVQQIVVRSWNADSVIQSCSSGATKECKLYSLEYGVNCLLKFQKVNSGSILSRINRKLLVTVLLRLRLSTAVRDCKQISDTMSSAYVLAVALCIYIPITGIQRYAWTISPREC